jgi:hypothetical protein
MSRIGDMPRKTEREARPLETRFSTLPVAAGGFALRTRGAASLFLIAGLALLAGCGGADLESKWLDRNVAVDGAGKEWRDATTYFEDEKLSVGLLNDGEFMYIALFVGEARTQAQVLTHGCTVWFDPSGDESEIFGVHYPLGMALGGGGGPDRNEEEMPRMIRPDADSLMKVLAAQPKILEILGPEPGELHTQGLRDNGIEVALRLQKSYLIYELKIPLAVDETRPYGVGAEPGAVIGVGLTTPEIQRPSRPRGRGPRMGGGMGGRGGFPGGAGGRPGGPGTLRRGERPEPPSPLEVWATVKLAAPPSPDRAFKVVE